MVFKSFMEIEISFLVSVHEKLHWEKLNSPLRSAISRGFQNQEYQFTIRRKRAKTTTRTLAIAKERENLQSNVSQPWH